MVCRWHRGRRLRTIRSFQQLFPETISHVQREVDVGITLPDTGTGGVFLNSRCIGIIPRLVCTKSGIQKEIELVGQCQTEPQHHSCSKTVAIIGITFQLLPMIRHCGRETHIYIISNTRGTAQNPSACISCISLAMVAKLPA